MDGGIRAIDLRTPLPSLLLLLACCSLPGCRAPAGAPSSGPRPPARAAPDLPALVNPMVGTASTYEVSRGNTYPAAALPGGMIQWTPQTGAGRWIYQHGAKTLLGLRGTHSPSVWMGDYGSFTVTPLDSASPGGGPAARLDHSRERSSPHHYRVTLPGQGITAEVTPTLRGGVMRFAFPAGARPTLQVRVWPGPGQVQVRQAEGRIVGVSRHGGAGEPPNFAHHFVLQLDRPITEHSPLTASADGAGPGVSVTLARPASGPLRVQIALGTSFISAEQAARNMSREVGSAGFEQVRRAARAAWQQVLSRVRVRTYRPEHAVTFYTALYRALLFPRVLHEPDPRGQPRHYSPFDGKVHRGQMFTDSGLWDTYRAQLPWLTLLYPARAEGFARALIAAADQGGWLPKWPSPGYRSVMIGTHADGFLADAWLKGLRGFDLQRAYKAMVKHATTPGDGRYRGRVGIQAYQKLGYVPASEAEHATARTLEFAYGDFCVGAAARALGKEDEARRFFARAGNYRKVFDPATGFMRGRQRDGRWSEPFSPTTWGNPYVEGCAWHYLWSVQQDIPGLMRLLGGREALAAKLDAMLAASTAFEVGSYGRVIHEMREQVLGKMGQYAHANEPLHHVLYLYAYAGQSHKTQRHVRRVMERLYGPGPDGLLGDEDTGQMSAWFLFSALGFYPVCPGQPIYVLGSPLVREATLHLPGGKTFTIRAPGNGPGNVYVQSARLNGAPLTRTWIRHETLLRGGTLTFQMGPRPNKAWGSRPEDAPPGAL